MPVVFYRSASGLQQETETQIDTVAPVKCLIDFELTTSVEIYTQTE